MIQAHEQDMLFAVIEPRTQSAGNTVTSSWAKVNTAQKYLALFMSGTLATNSTLDFSVRQATDSSGTGAKVLKAATQLTQAGSDGNKQVIISINADDLDTDNGFYYVALQSVVATADAGVAAILLGQDPIYGFDPDKDLSSVVEIMRADA